MGAVSMVDLWRGGRIESRHMGHAVVWHATGGLVESWGDAEEVIFPRSSCKMIQALPLLESGAGAHLSDRQRALVCASHQGAQIHVQAVNDWLDDLGYRDEDLRCGAHEPSDRDERDRLIRAGDRPCQCHNNCSGKHAGFLTLRKHFRAGPEYVEIDHPVQRAVAQALDEVTGETSPGYGIDGCSAPNFATSVTGLARAMAFFAGASETGSARERAAFSLARSMAAFPEMVAGEGRSCTELMRAMGGKVAIKTGAEAVFVAIIPEQKIGIALKIADGGTRAAEAAICALLIRRGVLDAAHPAALKRLDAVQRNWRGFETGIIRRSEGFCAVH